jgi:hypothetical protein
MMIEINLESIGVSTTRPYIEIIIADNETFSESKLFNALIDTGADISFINEKHFKDFNFFQKKDSRDGREQQLFKVYFRINNLVSSYSQYFGKRNNKNSNPNDKEPDILLGRDFLKNTKLTY